MAVASDLERARGPRPTRAVRSGRSAIGCALLIVSSLVAVQPRAHAQELRCGDPDSGACDNDWPAAAETARGLALGTGLRASAISTSALAYSPAALALGDLYHIEANIDYLAALNTVALGAAAVDSSTSKIGAGIAIRGFLSGDDGFDNETNYDYDGLDGRIGLGLSLSDAFAIGVSGRYIDLSTEADPDEDRELAQGFTMDASVRIIPVDGLQIDLAGLNFIDLDTVYVPITLAGSIAIAAAEALSIGGDVLVDMSSFDDPQFTVGAGVEYLGGNMVPIRIGYAFDAARELHVISAGVGYTDQKVGLDLGLRQEVAGGDATRVMAAVRYHVN